MVWAMIGALALLTAYLLPTRRAWFSLFGAFVLVLAADDVLTLHESGPRRVIPERAFCLAYAIVALLLVIGLLRRRFDEATVGSWPAVLCSRHRSSSTRQLRISTCGRTDSSSPAHAYGSSYRCSS